MAVEDIRLKLDFHRHPKTVSLKRRLGAEGVLALEQLWCWAATNRPNGDLRGLTVDEVELAAAWAGTPGKLVEALLALRWIDRKRKALVLHDWADHQPWIIHSKDRSRAAQLAAEGKWGRETNGHMTRAARLSDARKRGRHTDAEWAQLLAACNYACMKCGSKGRIVKDHVVPIYQGGSDAIDNLQPLCFSCNSAKGPDATDLVPADIRKRLRDAYVEQARDASAEQTSAPAPFPSSPTPYLSNGEERAHARATPSSRKSSRKAEPTEAEVLAAYERKKASDAAVEAKAAAARAARGEK